MATVIVSALHNNTEKCIRYSSPKWYEERIKLATLHFNTLALLNMLDMRVETGNCSVTVNGRQGDTVKRKMAQAKHEWRKEVWHELSIF